MSFVDRIIPYYSVYFVLEIILQISYNGHNIHEFRTSRNVFQDLAKYHETPTLQITWSIHKQRH